MALIYFDIVYFEGPEERHWRWSAWAFTQEAALRYEAEVAKLQLWTKLVAANTAAHGKGHVMYEIHGFCSIWEKVWDKSYTASKRASGAKPLVRATVSNLDASQRPLCVENRPHKRLVWGPTSRDCHLRLTTRVALEHWMVKLIQSALFQSSRQMNLVLPVAKVTLRLAGMLPFF